MIEDIQTLTIQPEACLLDAMRTIDRGACGIAMVVDARQHLLGVVTDGILRRAILGGAVLTDGVATYMYRQFTAVGPRTGRTEVLDLMRARTLSQIPIVDEEGRLLGLHLLREIVGSQRRPNWAVIMAGGRGERLRPLTDAIPKPMVKVAGRPILERIILHLVGFGIRRIFLSVNYLAEIIEQHFGNGSQHGCQIEYLREDQPLGTGGALALLPEPPTEPVLALNGDLVTQLDVPAMLEFHATRSCLMTMAVHAYAHTVPYGVLDVAEGAVRAIDEKPTFRWMINAGAYVLAPCVIHRLSKGAAFSLPALAEDCLARGEPVGAFVIDDDWLDVGQPAELRRARGEHLPS